MTPDWELLSAWHNAWLAADVRERDRLQRAFVADHPELRAEADALASASSTVGGFLDIPAIVANAQLMAQDDEPLPVESMVGPYRIVALLARGGMGDVYRATDVRLRRDVALKVLSAAGDARRIERFVREAQWTASLDHPNVVRLYDVGVADDRAYFVEELLDGETLRSRLARGPLLLAEVCRIAADVARGLIAAHGAGLIHRDLKPENIFLTRSGPAKILDFGIAKVEHDMAAGEHASTLTGVVLGTSGYMAPEQIRGGVVDARTDLFALGSVMFEMLTSRRAFERGHLIDTLHAIVYDPPATLESEPPGPSVLAEVVSRLLEKAPEARFQTAADLLAALQEVEPVVQGASSGLPTRAAVGAPAARRPGSIPQTRLRAAIALAVLVVVAAIAWHYWPSARPPAAGDLRTLAVFPFNVLPSRGDADSLEVGLAEVFISRMSRITSVRVLPLSATLRLQGEDPYRAGRQLGADYVLAGTLQRGGGQLRADVKLLSVRADDILWQQTFDGDDRVSVQDAIAGRVIEAIAPHLSRDVQRRLASPGTTDREAYEAYLNGRAHVSRPNRSDLKKAVEYFRTAVGRDQGFADAWAGLALALRMLPIAGDERPVDTFPAAKAAADRALALEPDHPEALAAHGMIAFYHDWEFGEAERLLRRALNLEPSALSHVGLAHILSNMGRHEEALAQIQRARALDSAWPIARALEAQFLFLARQYDKALAQLDALVQFEPNFPSGHLMRLYPLFALGQYQAALEACDQADELYARSGGTVPGQPYSWALALRGYALAKFGEQAQAERVLQQLHGFGRERYIPPYHLALVVHALGREHEALERLREAVEARDWFVIFLGTDPKWDDLRSTPAFDALLSRANLLEVSRAIKPEQMSRSAASSR